LISYTLTRVGLAGILLMILGYCGCLILWGAHEQI
jgi:hypothetical protein